MMSIRMLAAATVVAIGSIGGTVTLTQARPSLPEGMVTSLSVVPAAGGADVLIGVNGAVRLSHFALDKPQRIVTDITGATLGLSTGDSYDGVARGGITKLTFSQYSKNVVRIVITLDAAHGYNVVQEGKMVRITVDGAKESFARWQLGGGAVATAAPTDSAAAAKAAPAKATPAKKTEAAPQQAGAPAAEAAPKDSQPANQKRIRLTYDGTTIATNVAPSPSTPRVTEGSVNSLGVVPAPGSADVLVGVAGPVTLKHFALTKPNRIVADISGATLGLAAGQSYDGVARGGITKVAFSQYGKNVVRVVITLDAAHAYNVAQAENLVKINVDGGGEMFERWQLGAAPAVVTAEATTPAPVKSEPVVEQAAAPAREVAVEAEPKPEPKTEPKSDFKPDTKSEPRRAAPQQPSRQPRITTTYDGAQIADVLASFSASFNRTILPSRSVSGTVSAHIIDQPWDVALRAIMLQNGFDITEDANGIIYVDTYANIAERQATVPLGTRTFRLNYSKSMTIAPMVAQRLTRSCPASTQSAAAAAAAAGAAIAPGGITAVGSNAACPARGAVTADSVTNSLSITDVPSALASLEDYAKGLDLRQPQVNIKAKIVLVDRTQLEGLGLRYDLGTQRQFFSDIVPRLDSTGGPLPSQILLGGNTLSAIANASARVPSAALQLVYSSAIGNYDITTFLEAMQQSSLLDVQAEPSASVLNNRTANLTAGTQVPIRVIDAGSASGNTATAPRANVSFQQTGVILTVTPQITNNRQIQMRVHVENSDVQFEANDVGAVFPTQKVDNEVLVADGETAVMGGLTQTTLRVTKSGIPFLVDLPIIGRLFGVTNRQETKRDLLILITPHIIDEGQSSPPEGRP